MVGLLNWSLDILASDQGKKLIGFFPDVKLTKSQKKINGMKDWMRELQSFVVQKFVEDLNVLYEKGGMLWEDCFGDEWHFVPVLAFIPTDMAEAWAMKGTFRSSRCSMPCHMCTVRWKNFDRVVHFEELELRDAEASDQLILNHQHAQR